MLLVWCHSEKTRTEIRKKTIFIVDFVKASCLSLETFTMIWYSKRAHVLQLQKFLFGEVVQAVFSTCSFLSFSTLEVDLKNEKNENCGFQHENVFFQSPLALPLAIWCMYILIC